MNKQEVFDKVARHLLRQKVPAKSGGMCVYRADDGKRCAVGCLIVKEHYSPTLEGDGVSAEDVWNAVTASGVARTRPMREMLRALQSVHDGAGSWVDGLRDVAEAHKVSARVLK